jgi:hypothetical protein
MAWRPTRFLIEGELDNTVPGKITGWMRFAGKKEKIIFDLRGNFHRDIRGTRIYLRGDAQENEQNAQAYMSGFLEKQQGHAGDITAGLYPYDYVKGRCYIEWYSEDNGRVVLELDQDQLEIIGVPVPVDQSEPVSRQEQDRNMMDFMRNMAQEYKSNIEGDLN